jgi:hypothetical protein
MFMMKKKISTFLVSTTLLLITNTAYAHHPTISAEAVCDAHIGSVVINYTSTAWDSGDPVSRENAQIDVSFDGSVVGTGSYEAPDYSFSGSEAAPAGSSVGDVVTVTATAVADWGNGTAAGGSSSSTTVTIPEDDCGPDPLVNGRFTGGGHQIRVDGVRVTRGLTIHCDLLLSNNLEINWQGNRFHTLEHLTTIACTDDPEIGQAPPPAPLDTLIGTGSGRYNNESGYSIEFTLVDAGEPGREDKAAFLVYETANPANVVLEVPLQLLTGGNLQAHYDQPHK